jgi:hypothetical protein
VLSTLLFVLPKAVMYFMAEETTTRIFVFWAMGKFHSTEGQVNERA